MSKNIYVIDTSAFIFDQDILHKLNDCTCYIPLTVLEELDKLKNRQDEVGKTAREIVRKLYKLYELSNNKSDNLVFVLENGVKVIIKPFELKEKLPNGLDINTNDNKILSFCLVIKETVNKNVKLITKDLLLTIKAESFGISCFNYEKTVVEKRQTQLYTGYRTVILEQSEGIDKLFEEEKIDAYDILQKEIVKELFPNEFLILQFGDNQSALARYTCFNNKHIVQLIKNVSPCKIEGKNKEQKFAIDILMDPKVKLVTIIGSAGTGKTLMAIACGLHLVLETKTYKSLVVTRPIYPVGRDIGYLPGTMEEKLEPWISPVKDNLRFLLSAGQKTKRNEETLNFLFENGTIEIEAMTFIRGRSIANAFIIIDEAQNLNVHELKTIITRVGEGTKIVLTGDIEQIDNMLVDSTNNGLTTAVEKFKPYSLSGHVTLVKGERSEIATLAATIL